MVVRSQAGSLCYIDELRQRLMTALNNASTDQPTVLGGLPVRPEGPPDWPFESPAVSAALQRAIEERIWGKYHGPYCERLRDRLGESLECEHVLLCSSGTAAVELALRGIGVGPEDEVILAAYDFKGNFQDVLAVGGTPVLVDVDTHNWNLDPNQLEAAVSAQTRAIIVSHLHGGIVPMDEARRIADRHGLSIVEDACQMTGGTVCGMKAGTFGDVGVISFGGSKLLSAGRGGALFSKSSPEIIQRARLYAQRGNDAYPLTELQAAILIPQLEQLERDNEHRAANVAQLKQLLQNQSGLVPFRNRTPGHPPNSSQPGYYKLGFQYAATAFAGLSRDLFAQSLRAEGMAFDPGFRALHTIHSRRRFRQVDELLNAFQADQRVVTLHHPILLGTADDMQQIVEAVDKIRNHATMIRKRFDD